MKIHNTPSKPLLAEKEAAVFLGISKSSIMRRRYAGEIPHYRIGLRILYDVERHLIPYLERCERKTGARANFGLNP